MIRCCSSEESPFDVTNDIQVPYFDVKNDIQFLDFDENVDSQDNSDHYNTAPPNLRPDPSDLQACQISIINDSEEHNSTQVDTNPSNSFDNSSNESTIRSSNRVHDNGDSHGKVNLSSSNIPHDTEIEDMFNVLLSMIKNKKGEVACRQQISKINEMCENLLNGKIEKKQTKDDLVKIFNLLRIEVIDKSEGYWIIPPDLIRGKYLLIYILSCIDDIQNIIDKLSPNINSVRSNEGRRRRRNTTNVSMRYENLGQIISDLTNAYKNYVPENSVVLSCSMDSGLDSECNWIFELSF